MTVVNAGGGCVFLQASGYNAPETRLRCWLQLVKGRKWIEWNRIKQRPTLLLWRWPLSQTSPPQASNNRSVSSSLVSLFLSPSTCRAPVPWILSPHLLILFSEEAHGRCISSHCLSCCSATCEKVLACWQQPQEVSFPLKHNYPTVKAKPSHWWPRNTSKMTRKIKKKKRDWAEFMNFNSNPNSFSYLQAISSPFSLTATGATLLSRHRGRRKKKKERKNSDRQVLIYDSRWFFIISLPF